MQPDQRKQETPRPSAEPTRWAIPLLILPPFLRPSLSNLFVAGGWQPTTHFRAPAHIAVRIRTEMPVIGGFPTAVNGSVLYGYTPSTVYLYEKL